MYYTVHIVVEKQQNKNKSASKLNREAFVKVEYNEGEVYYIVL